MLLYILSFFPSAAEVSEESQELLQQAMQQVILNSKVLLIFFSITIAISCPFCDTLKQNKEQVASIGLSSNVIN